MTTTIDNVLRVLAAAHETVAQDARPLRLVRGPRNDVALAQAGPTQPVTLALGDWAQLLTLADDTPEAHRIEAAPVTLALTVPQVRAVCSLLESTGTDWAQMAQEAIAVQVHPSLLPGVDDCNPHGIARPGGVA